MDEKRRRAKEFLATVDWSKYDFSTAPEADMSFPDFDDDADRPVWFPNHYNDVPNMSCRHVPDLNAIKSGKSRRLWALYGVPVEWDFDNKAQIQGFIQNDRSRESGGRRCVQSCARAARNAERRAL